MTTPPLILLLRLDPAVTILETNDVIELRGGDFHDVCLFHGGDPVDQPRWNVEGVPDRKLNDPLFILIADRECYLSTDNVESLVFHFVVLEAKRFSCIDMQDFAHVTVSAAPDQFIAPWLRDV